MAYVPFGSQCDLPNSQTPMSQDAINAQNRRVARVGRRFVSGNVALDRLVTRLGGIGIGTVPGALPLASPAAFVNAPSCDAPIGGGSNAGLYGRRTDQYKYGVSMGGSAIAAAPAAGSGASTQVITDDVTPAAAAAAAANGSTSTPASSNGTAPAPGSAGAPTVGQPTAGSPSNPWPGPNWWVPSRRFAGRMHCQVPVILPLQTVFPANPNPTPIVLPGPGPAPAPAAAAAPASLPPVAGAPVGPPTFPTTGNACLDAALGYVIPSQLDPGQQFICAMAGYGMLGERPGPLLTQALVAWRNANPSLLPKVPLQSNVPPASMSMLPTTASSVLGVAGLDASAPSWQGLAIVVTLGAALGFLYARFGQKGRY